MKTETNAEQWYQERRQEVIDYLQGQDVRHGQISEYPAWDAFPYTSIWAIESIKSPGWVGWWVVCGDHPTDYISSKDIKEPRTAYESIAKLWLELCDYADQGKEHPKIKIEFREKEQIGILRERAELLLEWVAEETLWDYE